MAIQQLRYLFDYKRINSLENFIKNNVQNKVVADCGSGSGIITWLSLKYGASKVFCIEKDEDALLHLNTFLYGKNNKVEICQLDYTKEDLPKADLYIHDLYDSHLFNAELYGLLQNCKRQNITEIYPNNVKIYQGQFVKEYEQNTENKKRFDLLPESRIFYKINSKIYPTLGSSSMSVFNSKIKVNEKECIFDDTLLECCKLKFEINKSENIWWEINFNNKYHVNSLNDVHNRCNVGIQKTKDFITNLRSLLKSQP